MTFEFATAGRIIFGNGTLAQAAPAASQFGRRALVVTGRNTERARPLFDALAKEGVETQSFAVACEPTVNETIRAVELARKTRCELVIGFGGGSVLDLAKAVAALMTNPGDPLDYLEVIGKGRPLTCKPLPCIAIPTTAGTGSEVTKNSVLSSPEHKVKVSMRHPLMLPDLAIVDPECTLSAPPSVTAASGLDALTQLLEAFISRKASPMTDGFCREGLPLAVRSLRRVFENGSDLKARGDMALASLFGGLALANAGLGAVHGFSSPIGGMFGAPHGMVCAVLLPHVMKMNLKKLREHAPDSPALNRFTEFSRMTGGSSAEDGIQWIAALCRDLQVSSLSTLGIKETDFPALVEKAQRAGSMKTNPVELTANELTQILREAL
jgi:alcohol dehydrogenase class IV